MLRTEAPVRVVGIPVGQPFGLSVVLGIEEGNVYANIREGIFAGILAFVPTVMVCLFSVPEYTATGSVQLEATGGLRYVINQSLEPHVDPYLGSAEVWFPDDDARRAFNEAYVSDGIEDMVGDIAFLTSRTEMIGIP